MWGERIELLRPYQVSTALLERTGNPDVKFMHCLPAFHDTSTGVETMILEANYGSAVLEGAALKRLVAPAPTGS